MSLARCNFSTVRDMRTNACIKLFNEVVANPDHKLALLLPAEHIQTHHLRECRTFSSHGAKTNRFSKSFLPASLLEERIRLELS